MPEGNQNAAKQSGKSYHFVSEKTAEALARMLGVARQTVGRWVGDITERRREVRKVQALLLSRLGWSTREIGEHLEIDHAQAVRDVNDDILHHLTEDLLREAVESFDGEIGQDLTPQPRDTATATTNNVVVDIIGNRLRLTPQPRDMATATFSWGAASISSAALRDRRASRGADSIVFLFLATCIYFCLTPQPRDMATATFHELVPTSFIYPPHSSTTGHGNCNSMVALLTLCLVANLFAVFSGAKSSK